jgi:probable F420-dependent oxidoreductase
MIDTTMTANAARPVRFGLNLPFANSVTEIVDNARRASDVGFDVVLLGDHLGHQAPLAPLVAIADAVPSVRVGNLVLNAPLYAPALLVRDLATVDAATGGRLEIGLGSGYVESDFVGFGLPFPSANRRVELLGEHLRTMRTFLSSPDYAPAPAQTPPPILVADIGDKMMAVAAEHADVIAIAAQGHKDQIGERIDFIKTLAGSRFDQIELAFSFFQVSFDRTPDLTLLRGTSPTSTDEQLLQSVTLLHGSISQAAERIAGLREEFGISYFTLNLSREVTWTEFEQLLAVAR